MFGQLSVEDNLRSGGFVRRLSRRDMEHDLERLYAWFPGSRPSAIPAPG